METKASAKRGNIAMLLKYGFTPDEAHKLQSCARSLHRTYERECNEDNPNVESIQRRCENTANKLAKQRGLYLYYNSDPRGWPILIDRKPIAENDTARPDRICPY